MDENNSTETQLSENDKEKVISSPRHSGKQNKHFLKYISLIKEYNSKIDTAHTNLKKEFYKKKRDKIVKKAISFSTADNINRGDITLL